MLATWARGCDDRRRLHVSTTEQQLFIQSQSLRAMTTKFPENYGLGHLRRARASYRDPFSQT
jgi:hypothetical protein